MVLFVLIFCHWEFFGEKNNHVIQIRALLEFISEIYNKDTFNK